MSNNSRFSPFFLIESYLRKDLSPEEAANLLSEIRQNPAIFDLLRENIAADIWLEEFFSAKKDLLVSSDDLSHNSFDLTGDFEEQLTSFKRKNFPSDGILNNSEPEFPAEESLRTTIYIPPREDSPEPSPWKEWFTNKKSSKKKKESSLLLSWQKSNIPLIVLLCCIGAFLSLLVIHYFRSPNREWDIETATARIAQTIDAEWEPESEEWPKGRRFDQGEIKLKSGLVQIALKNGISLTLEGPVDFALNDLMSSFCNKGKVSVAVPHNAKNYEMLTPFSAIYDRGTEFFVQVSDRETDLTVIKGQVDCLPQKGNLISLKAEEALSVGISQQVKRIAPQKEIYISSGLFAQKLNIFVQKEQKKESEKIGAIDLRNDLAARFDFGKRGTDQFPNFAASKRYKNCAVQTAGIEYEEGAIPDSSAIRLKSKNGEIRSNLFGSESNLTIVLQVRIDRLRPMSNILFTAGENHNAPGTVLFQLIGSGDLNLRVRGKEENQYFHAASVISSSQFGVWTKLGVVFDEKNRAISFWKDGQLLKKLEWNDPVPISLANLSFMNGMIDRKSDRTHLYGAIQNVLIFNSALGAEDLESITK